MGWHRKGYKFTMHWNECSVLHEQLINKSCLKKNRFILKHDDTLYRGHTLYLYNWRNILKFDNLRSEPPVSLIQRIKKHYKNSAQYNEIFANRKQSQPDFIFCEILIHSFKEFHQFTFHILFTLHVLIVLLDLRGPVIHSRGAHIWC